jgi:VanZ family protein
MFLQINTPKFWHFLPAISWFLVSLVLLTLPGSVFPHEDWYDKIQMDKWIHISLFFGLCFLFAYPLVKYGLKANVLLPWLLLITAVAVAYGVIIEFVQRDFIPNRSFDVWDILADTIGCVLAFTWAWKKRS